VVRRHLPEQSLLGGIGRPTAHGSLLLALEPEAPTQLRQCGGELGRPELRSEIGRHDPRPRDIARPSRDGNRLDQLGSTAGEQPVQILDQRRQVRIPLCAEGRVDLSEQCVRERLMPPMPRVIRLRPVVGHHARHSRNLRCVLRGV
jgi:hypothetical protein